MKGSKATLFLQLIVYDVFFVGVDVTRICFGPLNENLCNLNIFFKNVFSLAMVQNVVVIVGIRYMYICRWKVYRQLEDSFLAFFFTVNSLMVASVMGYLR